uniref:Acyl_transf_3 domain-containing protein n=1 Tax=Caenorhabditis japonica TaxID=281687 RepID=A0A8R1DZL9_CAEJA
MFLWDMPTRYVQQWYVDVDDRRLDESDNERSSASPSASSPSICSQRSSRESCGTEDDDSSVTSSHVDSSVDRQFAPSIALTYRNPMSLTMSHSLLIESLSAFSIRSSLIYLYRNSTRDVKLINLFRVLSSFWVIFSHTCLFSLNFTDTVRSVAEKGSSVVGWRNFMLNSSLAVDTFLFSSACVVSYSIRKRILFRGAQTQFSVLKSFALLVHRCLRLLPALCLYLTFMGVVYNHLADGPFWNSNGMFGTDCNITTIWPHFSFVANFFPSTCVPWLWYIALDFQLYLTLPVIFFVLWKFRYGWILVAVLCIGSLTYRSLAYAIYTLPANMFVEMLSGKFEKAEMSFKILYTSPISRAPPFFIGTLTGWYICRIRSLGSLHSITTISLKLLALCLLIFALFGPFFETTIVIYSHAIIHRTLWSIGLAILVILAQNGYNFGLFSVLNGKGLVVLSRLSFGVYLSHEPVLLYYLNTLRQPMSPSSFGYFMFITISIYVISLLFAFFIAIVIEVPLLNLERKIFMKIRKANREGNGDGDGDDGQRMERHVSFNSHIQKFDAPDFADDDEMYPEEKTRQWLETGSLQVERTVSLPIVKEENLEATSTEC